MKNCFLLTVAMLIPVIAFGQKETTEKEIAEALLPLPDALRSGPTVVLDTAPGKRIILQKGTNGLICRANTSKTMFDVNCHTKALDPFYARYAELALAGKSNSEIRDTVNAEVASGKLSKPSVGATVYEMSGDSSESSLPLMAIFLPYATSESTGLSTQRDHYRPWLMWSGTAFAHAMIPGK